MGGNRLAAHYMHRGLQQTVPVPVPELELGLSRLLELAIGIVTGINRHQTEIGIELVIVPELVRVS